MGADRPAEGGRELVAEPRVPVATYRLQFNQRFSFEDAEAVVPYLHALGISDIYASSYLAARPGSPHGYDIVDHNTLNPEIGTAETYDRFVAALQARGMGQILDVVPNHMGIAQGANRWWNDVLENGPGSPYADFFDIDWDPIKRELGQRVLLPILGDQYGRVLEDQQLELEMGEGVFRLRYYDTILPIAPRSATQILAHGLDALSAALGDANPDVQEYQSIITALTNLPPRTETTPERIRERAREKEVIRRRLARLVTDSEAVRAALQATIRCFNGVRGEPRSFDLLDRLLADQAYRLAHWRVAADEINYRRFFDINELAAIRMENPAVFPETHRLILELVETGKVTGLRIDHPDGLFDPARYFFLLQRERVEQLERARLRRAGVAPAPETEAAVARATEAFQDECERDPTPSRCRPLYLIAEKILMRGERLPARWAIHGTTGYEFLSLANGLFVDASSARQMTGAYGAFTALRAVYPDVVYAAKRVIMEASMSSELSVLGHALSRLAERNRYARDFTLNSLTHALKEVIACFPVYRTYIDGPNAEVALQDRACVEVAVAFAKRRNPTMNVSIFDFVRDIVLLRHPETADEAYRRDQWAFVKKLQQVTAPVTAKGVEDTAFYRYNRLVSLNEVGGDPDQFGITVEEFHKQMAARQEKWPAGLSATSTHDTKRGEDVRARIHVLSEMPRAWRDAVVRWHRWNRKHTTSLDGQAAPDRNDEYLLYQTLVGAWPLSGQREDDHLDFVGRIQAYMSKATREAKVNTSWVNPNDAYDEAVRVFVSRILEPGPRNRFLPDFAQFLDGVARAGMVNSLSQTLVKMVAPGVPDFYQGSELWDLNLVDPDNRRPVDFATRSAALADLDAQAAQRGKLELARDLLKAWQDGRIKLHVIRQVLGCRGASPNLFLEGDYVPLASAGRHAGHVCAFARGWRSKAVVAIVPRLTVRLTGGGASLPLGPDIWGDARVVLPSSLAGASWRNVLTDTVVSDRPSEHGAPVLWLGETLMDIPLALLVREE